MVGGSRDFDGVEGVWGGYALLGSECREASGVLGGSRISRANHGKM